MPPKDKLPEFNDAELNAQTSIKVTLPQLLSIVTLVLVMAGMWWDSKEELRQIRKSLDALTANQWTPVDEREAWSAFVEVNRMTYPDLKTPKVFDIHGENHRHK